jgi:hypothetical protein
MYSASGMSEIAHYYFLKINDKIFTKSYELFLKMEKYEEFEFD